MEIINKSLLCEVLGIDERLCRIDKLVDNTLFFYTFHNVGEYQNYINIYELAHKNLKEWAKLKNVFDIIDWSEEPEQIFKKAEELRNEIN